VALFSEDSVDAPPGDGREYSSSFAAHTGGMVRTVEVVTSLLALIAASGALAVLAARVFARRSPAAARFGAKMVSHRAPISLAIAGVAMLGSLYFSEVEHFLPCRWCWFQRVAMYPLAAIALIGLIRRDANARWYLAPIAAVGAVVSTYHYLLEWGVLKESDSCALFGPACSDIWFREFGFVTLAFMALCGFVAIVVFNTVSFPADSSPTDDR
jgi:disulfide bond formation protein DsbB